MWNIQGHVSQVAIIVILWARSSQTFFCLSRFTPHRQWGSLPTISVARMVVWIVPFHSGPIVPRCILGVCVTLAAQVYGREWMPTASDPRRSGFCAFSKERQPGFPLSIVSMPEVLLHIASPELNGTVPWGLSPKATFVKFTAFLAMDIAILLPAYLHR